MTDLITKWPVELDKISRGSVFSHTFTTIYGPLAPNPVCRTRFALAGTAPNDLNTRSAFYIADSCIAALWEVVLRGVRPNAWGEVYLAPGDYVGRSVVTMTAKRDIPLILRVDRPRRYRIVDAESPGDTAWNVCSEISVHELTHGAAHAVDRFLRGHGVQHAGLGWRSKQYPEGTVYVLYAPPFIGDDWELGDIVDLASPEGVALIKAAVEKAGFSWAVSPDEKPDRPELPDP